MLKDMIKGIMHDPDYMEVCHETLANANWAEGTGNGRRRMSVI